MNQPIWRVPAGRGLRWRSWDGEHLVYHENSGDTHRLNAVGEAVLLAIAEDGSTTEQVIEQVATVLRAERSTLAGPIAELLARFEDLGLIESIDERRPGPRGSSAR